METKITNTLQIFTNEELNANIRVIEIDGQPFFFAKDVCESFGIPIIVEVLQDLMMMKRDLFNRHPWWKATNERYQ